MTNKHEIYDGDIHFLIDPVSRKIKNQSKKKSLVRGEHNSERFTFEIQRFIEGHDMSLCNEVEIHYENMADEDIYVVKDLTLFEENENVVVFSWLVSRNATSNVGTLKYAIHFLCNDYDLRTQPHTISIIDTVDNTETIEEKYLDIFERHDAQIVERERAMQEGIEAVTGNSYDNVDLAIQDIQSVFDIVGDADVMIEESGVIAYDDTFKD